jgi:hypothetical protein
MKKAVRAGYTPGSWSFFSRLPVVHIMGKHSREEVNLLPHSRASWSGIGRTAAWMPQAREAAASSSPLSFMKGKYRVRPREGEARNLDTTDGRQGRRSARTSPRRLSRKASQRVIKPASALCSSTSSCR